MRSSVTSMTRSTAGSAQTLDFFDSAQECKAAKAAAAAKPPTLTMEEFKMLAHPNKEQNMLLEGIDKQEKRPKGFATAMAAYEEVQWSFAACIATNDPRLAGK